MPIEKREPRVRINKGGVPIYSSTRQGAIPAGVLLRRFTDKEDMKMKTVILRSPLEVWHERVGA